MNNRLLNWPSFTNKIVNSQFGFQPQKPTIYFFHSTCIILKAIRNGNKLYCAFVDFSKAFDRIDKNLLWFKLFELLIAVEAMYEIVKYVIKCKNYFARPFDVLNGVKQGVPLCPILFILYS